MLESILAYSYLILHLLLVHLCRSSASTSTGLWPEHAVLALRSILTYIPIPSTPFYKLGMLPTALVITVLGLVSSSLSFVDGRKAAKPDSKIARNVLEGKSEGYCSVSVTSDSQVLHRSRLTTMIAIWSDRIDALSI